MASPDSAERIIQDFISKFGGFNFINNGDVYKEQSIGKYYNWLQQNFTTLNKKQKNDYTALYMKGLFSSISRMSETDRAALDPSLKMFYNSGVNSIGNINFIDQAEFDKLQSDTRVSDITSYGNTGGPRLERLGKQTDAEKTVYNTIGFDRAKDIYKYTDAQGNSKYYYVLKTSSKLDKTLSKQEYVTPSITSPFTLTPSTDPNLDSLQKQLDAMKKWIGSQKATVSSTTTSSKPVQKAELFYSADYKTIYDTEIQRMVLQILAIADIALTNYDYRTIDRVPEKLTSITYNKDGSVSDIQYNEPRVEVVPNISSAASDIVVDIQTGTIQPIIDRLINTSVEKDRLYYFGSKKGTSGFNRYYPAYDASGQASYNLEIYVTDSPLVENYKVYLIREDDTI